MDSSAGTCFGNRARRFARKHGPSPKTGYTMSVKATAKIVAIVAAIGAAGFAFERFALGWKPENRLVLYEVRQTLKPGMTESEVTGLIDRTWGTQPRAYRADDRRYMTLSVRVGLQSEMDLRLEFKDARLVRAMVRDADNGQRPIDAPPDL